MSGIDWRWDALCAQTDPELFFPEMGGYTGKAKAVCRECPVVGECLKFAMDNNIDAGIWGGMSPAERRRWKRWAA